jgi:hypothetical protein
MTILDFMSHSRNSGAQWLTHAIIIPHNILSAILLLKNNAWRNIQAAIWLVKLFTYGLVLIAGTIVITLLKGGKWDPLLAFYVFIFNSGMILLFDCREKENQRCGWAKHELKMSQP